MKINKYHSFAYIYFFFNSIALPHGLLYTMLLTPFFYLWLIIKGQKLIIIKLLFVLLPYIVIHLWNGVYLYEYFKSFLIVVSAYLFCYAVFIFVKRYPKRLEEIFHRLIRYNFYLTLLAISLFFTPFWYILWMYYWVSPSLGMVARLSMLTYEPSYYSTLLTPLVLYVLLSFIKNPLLKRNINLLLMVSIPLALSFSFGVISCILLSLFLFLSVRVLQPKVKNYFIKFIALVFILAVFSLLVMIVFYPNNPIFARLGDIFAGKDLSGQGRTTDAFYLAYKIAELKSIWWGVGFGQIKVIGDPIIREYYLYPPEFQTLAIPNTLGETLAIFGFFGIIIRFTVLIVLFFKTKVLRNDYRTLLFFFVFIYQFTGSFYINIAELIIWILAFSKAFPQFDKKSNQIS